MVCFYKRFKSSFITFHSSIYDVSFNCNSHTISFLDNNSNLIQYGNIIIFLSTDNGNKVLIQKYISSDKQMSNYVDVPSELHHQINIFFPLVTLSNNFTIVPLRSIRHKCICVPVFDLFSISEIRVDHEHD
jgi:alkyl hydroperoxide reductase subunit AhpC